MRFRERNYRNLKAWVAAHSLAVRVYKVTEAFPECERFGLVVQLRRSLASVAANLAEGSGRSSDAAFANFVEVAYASAAEADYQLLLARDVGHLCEDVYAPMADDLEQVRKMLAALRRRLRANGQ